MSLVLEPDLKPPIALKSKSLQSQLGNGLVEEKLAHEVSSESTADILSPLSPSTTLLSNNETRNFEKRSSLMENSLKPAQKLN
jgi:hypothetical protein